MDTKARQFALERIEELLESHRAAVESMRIVSQSEARLADLAVAMQFHQKFEPEKKAGDYKRRSHLTVSRTKKFVADEFPYHRGMLLVALCSVIDVAVRDVVAERLSDDRTLLDSLPQDLGSICKRAIKSNSGRHETPRELFFSAVDSQFRYYPQERGISYTKRFRYWLSLVKEDAILEPNNDLIIDEGFLARNWIIHRSESAMRRLQLQSSRFLESSRSNVRIAQAEITIFAKACQSFVGGIGLSDL